MIEQTTRATGKCTRCLCCLAIVAFDGEKLCAACDDGTHPPLPDSRPAPAIDLPAIDLEPIGIEPIREKSHMTITSGRNCGARIGPEIKRAVLAAPVTVSNSELARKYEITDVTVGAWRRAAGIVVPGRHWLHAAGRLTKSARTEAPAPLVPDASAIAAAPSTAEVETFWTDGHDAHDAQPEEVLVNLSVRRATLDAWWRSLGLADKAALFAANYVIRLEGVVS
jgi:hypothetical protein